MAEQLHISVSTVKRALKELAEVGYIQKEARSRANIRGQTSNLYTLILLEQAPTPNNDSTFDHEDNIDVPTENTVFTATVTHISFATMQAEKQEQAPVTIASTPTTHTNTTHIKAPCKPRCIPAHFAPFVIEKIYSVLKRAKEKAGHFLPCNSSFYGWTGMGFNLQPP